MTIGNGDDCLWDVEHCGFARRWPAWNLSLPDKGSDNDREKIGWDNDRETMLIANADRKNLYKLGKQGCDLSAPLTILIIFMRFVYLDDSHTIALHHMDLKRSGQGAVFDIAKFVGPMVTAQ